MEAKGCAKPAVWKDARRYFYWAVRARVAKSSVLAKLAEAAPNSTYEYRSQLLESLANITATSDNRAVAESVEKIDLSKTLAQLRVDDLLRRARDITNQDRAATMDGLIRLFGELTEDERLTLATALQNTGRHGESPVFSRVG
jgi:acetyl-CoA carboxylase/biotin carboxylase 1